jgi:flagellar motor switch protein FliG
MNSMEEVNAAIFNDQVKLQEAVTTMVRERPKDTVQLIRTWLLETGRQKAAVFFITIGSELSSGIFKCLSEDEVETIASEITRLETIEPDEKDAVLQEFQELMTTNRFVSTGGIDIARRPLKQSLNRQKAAKIIDRLTSGECPFGFIRTVDPTQILNFIQAEHPQTIAVILSHLEPKKASVILESLDHDIKSEVVRRIAIMDIISPEVLRELERTLEKKLSTLSSEDYSMIGGVESSVGILKKVDKASGKQIIKIIENEYPGLAEEIWKCKKFWKSMPLFKRRKFGLTEKPAVGDNDD